MTDLLVIGGGAAGLMAAGAACAKGLTVTVLEHNPKGPGQKLLITGKGRCNVTSDSDVREFLPYVRHNGRFLYSSLYAFPPASAMQLFEELGVPLKTERGRRVFPQSDRAADVLAALRDYARDAEFVRGSAKKLLLEDGVCKGAVTDRGETLRAESTSGPDRPKWVNSASPCSVNSSLPSHSRVSRTLRRARPIMRRQAGSGLMRLHKLGCGVTMVCPACRASL